MAKRILANCGDECSSVKLTSKSDPALTPDSVSIDEGLTPRHRFINEFQGIKGSQVTFHNFSEDSNMSCEEPLSYSPKPTCINENFYSEVPGNTFVLNSLLEFSSKDSSKVNTCNLNARYSNNDELIISERDFRSTKNKYKSIT